MSAPRPPVLAVALLRLVLPPQDRMYALGDLAEEFRAVVRESGRSVGRLWYWRQTFSAVMPSVRRRVADFRRERGEDRAAGIGLVGHRDSLVRDIRLAMRILVRRPVPTIVVVTTLALGIGATTAIFTVVDSVVLRQLPFPDADRLYALCETNERLADFCVASPPNVEDWSARSSSFEVFGLGRSWSYLLKDGEGSVGLSAGLATPEFFSVFGLRPHLGRLFVRDDLVPGANQRLVLSHAFWERRFGSDPDIVGRTLSLDDRPYEVVGVLEAGVRIPQLGGVEAWTPLHFYPTNEERRDWRGFITVGRLREDVSLERAREEMTLIASQLAEEHPAANRGWGVRVEPLRDEVLGSTRGRLLAFLGAVGFVLLVACVNVANLRLAQATQRRPEFAVRVSLGSGRGRLARMLLTESLLLSTLGGGAGLVIAYWSVPAFIALAPAGIIPGLGDVRLDGRILFFAAAITVLTTVLFGLVPALQSTRVDLTKSVKESDRGGAAVRLRGLLIAWEVALSFVLLVGAGLFGRTFLKLAEYDPGFDIERLLLVSMFVNSGGFESTEEVSAGEQITRHFQLIADEVRAIPGVDEVGVGSAGPLFGGIETYRYVVEGREPPPAGREPSVRWFDVGPRYFEALGLPLIRGRGISDTDVRDGPSVAVVNEAFVRRHWSADEDPLGALVHLMEADAVRQIVGVVADVRPFSPDKAVEPQIYWPQAQSPRLAAYMVIRTDGAPKDLVRVVEDRVLAFDPDLSLRTFRSMEDWLGSALATPRFSMLLVGIFALIAMSLTCVGIYGVMAYGVSRRTHEIGLRLSLGASSREIVRLVLARSLRMAGLGMVIGALTALGVTRLLSGMLDGVTPWDPITFAGTALFMTALTAVAGYVPARRASQVRPVEALRAD